MRINEVNDPTYKRLGDCSPGDVVKPVNWDSWWLVVQSRVNLPKDSTVVYLADLNEGGVLGFDVENRVSVAPFAEVVIR